MTRYVGLVRGINVGGNRALPMATLRGAVEVAGGNDVATYIQSGNFVFSHRQAAEATLVASIERAILAAAGFEPRVMLRTAKQLTAIIAANPYPITDPKLVHVGFFPEPPQPTGVSSIDRSRFEPDEFTVAGREIYVHVARGWGVSKLPAALAALRVDMTVRNWRTVLKLAEMVDA